MEILTDISYSVAGGWSFITRLKNHLRQEKLWYQPLTVQSNYIKWNEKSLKAK